ncbi:MAG: hypothetical protein D6808_01190 [Candidatus Dadabacteria bacterium]|nr:MAG: hypothetical protein D6808_01190 [Candidatus Dadabacteria bacterium]
MCVRDNSKGSIELIVLGLLAALIVVLAMPLLKNIGEATSSSLSQVYSGMTAANGNGSNSDSGQQDSQ